ncbi:hypothetical protein SAMN05216571_101310 [Onishia taeanensis]|uniref:Uncharacterized protein n=1 Tax=Onishia taeanensis TaxID=284577 RepID=A0A1G7N9L4_9GAMM|nr:hypothetical protein [Halomonas taeanensis]SDF70743.1 hypothetical protein SAMN05216571_101310 [Halomonas taeanensis]
MSSNHACRPRKLYLEITGHHGDNDQNAYALYRDDQLVEALAEDSASEGRYGPIVETAAEYLEDELADVRLVQSVGEIEIELLSEGEVTRTGLVPKQRDFQHHLMVSCVPMQYLDHEEIAAGPCRGGFLYVFLNGRLIRELAVSVAPGKAPVFVDSDVASYREQGEVPVVREYTGPELASLHLPLRLDGEAADVRLAYSDHPWPWSHVIELEAEPARIQQRAQPLPLNTAAVTAMLDGHLRNQYAHGLEMGRDETQGKAALEWLPPMRDRDPLYEQARGSARDYLEDVSGEQWAGLVQQLQDERGFFESDEQEASVPDLDMRRRQRDFAPALRTTLVQQWNNPRRSDEDRADDALLELIPAPAAGEDVLASLKDQQLCAIFLRDPKRAVDQLIDDIQANQELLWVLSEGMKYHPHGKSAELVLANCFMPTGPDGQENPVYLDEWFDRRLDRSRESLFARLIKEEERRLARLRLDERLTSLAEMLEDASPGAFGAALRDAMPFDDLNHLEPYALLSQCLEPLMAGMGCLDPKATPAEAQQLQAPARCRQTLDALFIEASHPLAYLLYAPEHREDDGWGESHARDLAKITQGGTRVADQASKVATHTGDMLIAQQQRLDEEEEGLELGDAMGLWRMAMNGMEALASSVLPSLLNIWSLNKLGEDRISLILASDLADLEGAMMGKPIRVTDQNGRIMMILPDEVLPLTHEMAAGGVALQVAASAENAMGGEAVASSSATAQKYRVSGQVTTERAFRWTQSSYMGLWSALAGLELWNLYKNVPKVFAEDSSELDYYNAGSALIDASLLTLQGLKLANVRWGLATKFNQFLDIRMIKSPGWKEALGEAGQVRGFAGLSAGLFTSGLVAIEGLQLYQKGLKHAALWKWGASGSIAVGAYVGTGYGQAAANIAAANLARNRFLNGLLGLIGTPRPVPVMVGSLVVALVCQYMASEARDDRFSLWVHYGPFGHDRDSLGNRLEDLTEEAEEDATMVDKRDYLDSLRSSSPEEAYFQLLQGIFKAHFDLVTPGSLLDIDPRFRDCDIAVRMTCPALRHGEFTLPIPNLMAEHLAPVPDMVHFSQYAPMDRRRLLVRPDARDPEDSAIRYLGLQLHDGWGRMAVPEVSGQDVVPADWYLANKDSFRDMPGFSRAHARGEHLVRLELEAINGEGSIAYWDAAERKNRQFNDQVSLLVKPTALIWPWNKQGGRT